MADLSSDMVRSLVLRELEDGVRHDGLWLQAMSECKLDQNKAKQRYIEFGCEGQAGKIQPTPLPMMAAKYQQGMLEQVVN
jgi:hypothetical protein